MENVEIRNLNITDYKELRDSMDEAYASWSGYDWEEHHIKKLLHLFPEGQIAVTMGEKVVGAALSICVKFNDFGDDHTYREITANHTFKTHNPKGDVLYGLEIFIHPDYRGMRLGRRLYDARKELCESLNLKSIIAGGRLPGYHKYADELTPREYLQKVRSREILDPVLTFQIANDFHVKKILKNYLAADEESRGFATLLEWNNVFYEKDPRKIALQKSAARIGLVQWQMRLFPSVESLYEQIEFFVDTVAGYKSDFVLFPELFNAPLMAEYNHLNEAESIRKLADHTLHLRDKFIELAVKYNVNIITGSMPQMRRKKLYNVGYLCRRDGTHEMYEKIHITPNELHYWGLVGGNKIRVFDTDAGKIGVLICYDVEFPELPRVMADLGMQILFVPFLTDTQNAYTRVRACARARAIENECFVAIAGCVGNLPRVENMDIQFAQSVVFTPSDFPFPTNGVKAEATPNTEAVLIVDVDLDLLKELHHFGTVRTRKDRRYDLYEIRMKRKQR